MQNDVTNEVWTMIEEAWQALRQVSEATGAHWFFWLAAAIGLTIGLRIVRMTLSGLFRARRQDAGKARNLVANIFRSTTSIFLFLASLLITAPLIVTLSGNQRGWLEAAFMVAGVLQIALWIRVVVSAVMDDVVARQAQDSSTFRSARNLIAVFLNVAIFAVAAVMIIDNLGGDVTALLAGLGVGGIAVGLAAQNLFRDLFASLAIILDKPFEKGDFIRFGDYLGTVEKIGLKTTHIAALSGEQLIIGNSDLTSQITQNYRRMTERRVVLRLAVTYATPRDVLAELPDEITQLIKSMSNTRFDRCHVADYGDSAIVIEAVYFVLSADYNEHMSIKERVQLDIHALFERRGVDFAFPTRTLMVQQEQGVKPRDGNILARRSAR